MIKFDDAEEKSIQVFQDIARSHPLGGDVLRTFPTELSPSKLRDTKNHSVRTVPLTDNAFQTIEAALKFRLRPKNTKLLFYGEPCREELRKGYTINRVWARLLKELK